MQKYSQIWIWVFFAVTVNLLFGCAGRPPRDPNFTYLDEVKFTKKGELSFVGLFTTQPVKSYSADKVTDPLAVIVYLDSVYLSETRLPKKIKDDAIESIEAKSVEIDGRPFVQAIVHLKKDSDFSVKQTEYGVRLDLKEGPSTLAESPEIITPPETEMPPIEQETMAKAEEQREEQAKQDLEEQAKTEAETAAPALPQETPALEPAPELPKKTLDSITRSVLPSNKDRVTLSSSEAVEFHKTLLDRELVIELKGIKTADSVSNIDLDEEDSYLRKVRATTSDDPFPSTKVSFIFKDSLVPEITQEANLIHIDFIKPKVAKALEDDEFTQDFGNYLTSPSKLPGRALSIQTKDADIHDVLRLLSETSDYNMIIGKDVSGKVSVRLVKVPWDEALIMILQSHQLGFVKQGNILRIASLNALKEEKEKAKEALTAKDGLESLHTLFLPLNNRQAGHLTRHIYPLLSERGSLSVDRLTNTIIMRDISSVLKRAQKLAQTLDVKK